MLLGDRREIRDRLPMPVCDMSVSSQSISVAGESVAFTDGAAAGTTQKIKLVYDKVLSEYGDRIGHCGDTSLSFTTGTVLTTEVEWKYKNIGGMDTDTKRLATLENGEYMVDYENGYILGKSATATATSTDAASYKIRKHDIIDVTLEVGDIEIGAVELKSATSENRALISAAGELSVLDTNSAAALVLLQSLDTNIDLLKVAVAKADEDVHSSMDHGSNRDVDNAVEQLTATSFNCKKGVLVKADITNTGIVYVGNADVTDGDAAATDGIPLSAGEWVELEIDNPDRIYVHASAANQVVYWLAI